MANMSDEWRESILEGYGVDLEETKKWIQKAIKKPGSLSKQLGVPEEENIPMSKLKKAAKKGGKLGKRANLAMTLKGLKEGKGDGNLANNYPPFDKVTRGDVIAGALGQDQMGGKKKKKKVTAEEVESIDEATAGTRKVASYGDPAHRAEVRYNSEYGEYQVHHYKDGKHMGEGPVSYHGDDKEDAHNTAKYEVAKRSVKEEVEAWVNELVEEGYDLSDFTWEEMAEIYMSELYKGKHGQSETEYMAGRSDAGKRISGDADTGPRYYTLGRSRGAVPDAPTKPGAKPVNTPKLSSSEKEYHQYRKSEAKNRAKYNKVGGSKGLPG